MLSPSRPLRAALRDSRTLGAEVEYWELREELGWKPDIEELKRLVRPNTKLICINNASNPIGTVLDTDMLGQIAEIAVVALRAVRRGVSAARKH